MFNEVYRVALFGHRDFCQHKRLDDTLSPLIKELLRTKAFVEFYIGRDGEFDIYAASIIKRVQTAMGTENSELNLVLPYVRKDIEYYEKYYDRVSIPICVHPKIAITKRNEWVVEQADLVICYVERKKGGAYTAMRYAETLGKEILNLANKNDL